MKPGRLSVNCTREAVSGCRKQSWLGNTYTLSELVLVVPVSVWIPSPKRWLISKMQWLKKRILEKNYDSDYEPTKWAGSKSSQYSFLDS